jgi:hypothetical protein
MLLQPWPIDCKYKCQHGPGCSTPQGLSHPGGGDERYKATQLAPKCAVDSGVECGVSAGLGGPYEGGVVGDRT